MAMRSQETRPERGPDGRWARVDSDRRFLGSGGGGEYLVAGRKGMDELDICGRSGSGWSNIGLPKTLENGIEELDFCGRRGAGIRAFCGLRGVG